MRGLSVYKTYLGMLLHFKGNVDGWQYNFTGKVTPEKFAANKRLVYMYAALENEFPTKVEQIKFFYPAFKALGYVKPDFIMGVRREHKKFVYTLGEGLPGRFFALLESLLLEGHVQDIHSLFDNSELLPKFYQLYHDELITYEESVILTMVIPELLNSIVSKEPIVFESWKRKLEFDRKFYLLYISQPVLKQLRDATVEAFKHTVTKVH